MLMYSRYFESDDLIRDLGLLVDQDVKHYKNDFDYDKEFFIDSVKQKGQDIIWFTRDCGTGCMYERNAYINETYGNAECMTFLPDESAKAYVISITGAVDGKISAKIYPVDKDKLLEDIDRYCVSAREIEILPENGDPFRISYAQYNANPYGFVRNISSYRKEYYPSEDDERRLARHFYDLKNDRKKALGTAKFFVSEDLSKRIEKVRARQTDTLPGNEKDSMHRGF